MIKSGKLICATSAATAVVRYHFFVCFRTNSMIKSGKLADISVEDTQKNYKRALEKGVLKILSKMGISLLSCYHGAQIFEIYGLGDEIVDTAFRGSVSRIGGMTFDDLQKEVESFWIKVGHALDCSFAIPSLLHKIFRLSFFLLSCFLMPQAIHCCCYLFLLPFKLGCCCNYWCLYLLQLMLLQVSCIGQLKKLMYTSGRPHVSEACQHTMPNICTCSSLSLYI